MNKRKYLAELAGLLSFLSEEERSAVLSHFTKKFEEAGESGEALLIMELGPPMRLVIALNREGIESIIDAEAEIPEKGILAFKTPAGLSANTDISAEESISDDEPATEADERAETVVELVETEDETSQTENTDKPEEEEIQQVTDLVPPAVLTIEEVLEENTEPLVDESRDLNGQEIQSGINTVELIREVMREEAVEVHPESFPELSVVIGKAPRTAEPETDTKVSVFGAILFGFLLIIPGVPLLAISIVLLPTLVVPVIADGVAVFYGFFAGIATIAYMPDAFFVFGSALIALGLGALYLVLCIWLIVQIIAAWRLGLPALYRRLVKKGGAK